ncbi:MAG: hypothetical protein BWX68_00201 [Verrucomicrobia bacterium ADurb.Bin063]|jgi:hypothetical protein|nr:MAG: hypothetical protein BWX68_00201 [Verrucomicrobia bacterium ADurb.Bin063]
MKRTSILTRVVAATAFTPSAHFRGFEYSCIMLYLVAG